MAKENDGKVTENNASSRWSRSDNRIFSREALDKMRSPEKLDMILPITTPISWMGLIAVGVTVFSVLLWSVFGSFTVKADGMGMIMDPGGVVTVSPVYGGKLDKIYMFMFPRMNQHFI